MVLHCCLGQVENAANRLVAFSLHYKRKHVKLSLGQPKIRRRDPRPTVGKPLFVRLPSQWLGASKGLQGNMLAATGKDELQRSHIEGTDEAAMIPLAGEDDQNCRRSPAQLGDHGTAVPIRLGDRS